MAFRKRLARNKYEYSQKVKTARKSIRDNGGQTLSPEELLESLKEQKSFTQAEIILCEIVIWFFRIILPLFIVITSICIGRLWLNNFDLGVFSFFSIICWILPVFKKHRWI